MSDVYKVVVSFNDIYGGHRRKGEILYEGEKDGEPIYVDSKGGMACYKNSINGKEKVIRLEREILEAEEF